MYLSRRLQQQLHTKHYKISRQFCHYKWFQKIEGCKFETSNYTTKVANVQKIFALKD